jgi:acetyl esterase/lipase
MTRQRWLRVGAVAAIAFLGLIAVWVRVSGPTVLRDVAFNPWATMDVYESGGSQPAPLAVFIHGGGWGEGDKSGWSTGAADLAGKGWVAASVNYRLASRYHFPDPVDDVISALKWIHDNAARLHVDTTRVVLIGDSAGGELAMATAFNPDIGKDQSVKIRAVISWSGVLDLNDFAAQHGPIVTAFLGCSVSACPSRAAQADPKTIVRKGLPAALLINSSNELIPVGELSTMAAALRANGTRVETHILPGDRHGLAYANDVWDETVRFADQAVALDGAPAASLTASRSTKQVTAATTTSPTTK